MWLLNFVISIECICQTLLQLLNEFGKLCYNYWIQFAINKPLFDICYNYWIEFCQNLEIILLPMACYSVHDVLYSWVHTLETQSFKYFLWPASCFKLFITGHATPTWKKLTISLGIINMTNPLGNSSNFV